MEFIVSTYRNDALYIELHSIAQSAKRLSSSRLDSIAPGYHELPADVCR